MMFLLRLTLIWFLLNKVRFSSLQELPSPQPPVHANLNQESIYKLLKGFYPAASITSAPDDAEHYQNDEEHPPNDGQLIKKDHIPKNNLQPFLQNQFLNVQNPVHQFQPRQQHLGGNPVSMYPRPANNVNLGMHHQYYANIPGINPEISMEKFAKLGSHSAGQYQTVPAQETNQQSGDINHNSNQQFSENIQQHVQRMIQNINQYQKQVLPQKPKEHTQDINVYQGNTKQLPSKTTDNPFYNTPRENIPYRYETPTGKHIERRIQTGAMKVLRVGSDNASSFTTED